MPYTLVYFPDSYINLQKEIPNHPDLVKFLDNQSNELFEVRLAEVAAYCGVILNNVVLVAVALAILAVVSFCTIHTGLAVQELANVSVHTPPLILLPTVTIPVVSFPKITGLVPQSLTPVPTAGAVPVNA